METKRMGVEKDLTLSGQQIHRIRLHVYLQIVFYVTTFLSLTMIVLAARSPSSEGLRVLTFPLLFFSASSVSVAYTKH